MKATKLLFITLLASALALPALAQPGPPEPKQAASATRAAKGERLAAMRARLLRERVGLSDEKAREVEGLVRQSAAARRQANTSLAAAQRELDALFASDSEDQAAWAAALERLKSARDALEALRGAEHEALAERLTPKEHAKLLRVMQRVSRHLSQGRQKAAPGTRGEPKDPLRPDGPRGKASQNRKAPPSGKPEAPPRSKPTPGKTQDPFDGRH